MKHLLTKGMIALTLVLTPVVATAAPIQVGIGAFSGLETVLDFDGVLLGQTITNQFVGQGVDFSGSTLISGSTAGGTVNDAHNFFTSPGTAVLQNFLTGVNCLPCQPVVIDFLTPMQLIGMDLVSAGNSAAFTVENTLLGTSTLFNINVGVNNNPDVFAGFFDPAGINRITIATSINGAIGLNDLRLEQPVPEPSTMLLMGTGLAGMIGWRYRKQQA